MPEIPEALKCKDDSFIVLTLAILLGESSLSACLRASWSLAVHDYRLIYMFPLVVGWLRRIRNDKVLVVEFTVLLGKGPIVHDLIRPISKMACIHIGIRRTS